MSKVSSLDHQQRAPGGKRDRYAGSPKGEVATEQLRVKPENEPKTTSHDTRGQTRSEKCLGDPVRRLLTKPFLNRRSFVHVIKKTKYFRSKNMGNQNGTASRCCNGHARNNLVHAIPTLHRSVSVYFKPYHESAGVARKGCSFRGLLRAIALAHSADVRAASA